ncbi:MAG: AbrB/MazE/SpoVT family DNA-binding domain-containing protein [Candidatus Diapherotrites archaeon]|nr:AbrB/MazE/SpoVT family DNA-binding domain-containing protein [Candidatus Diapherotrites archaeon]
MAQIEIITVSRKGQVVLPKNVREHMHISQGSKLLLIQKDNQLTLSKIDSLIEEEQNQEKNATAFASEKALAKDWLSKEEDEAWKSL